MSHILPTFDAVLVTGMAYLNTPSMPVPPRARKSARDYINYAFEVLTCTHDVSFVTSTSSPYRTHTDMIGDYSRGRLVINTNGNDPISFTKSDNLKFRAVHDSHHCIHNLPFGWIGEYPAHLVLISECPDAALIWKSEVWYQTCAYYASGSTFASQKFIILRNGGEIN